MWILKIFFLDSQTSKAGFFLKNCVLDSQRSKHEFFKEFFSDSYSSTNVEFENFSRIVQFHKRDFIKDFFFADSYSSINVDFFKEFILDPQLAKNMNFFKEFFLDSQRSKNRDFFQRIFPRSVEVTEKKRSYRDCTFLNSYRIVIKYVFAKHWIIGGRTERIQMAKSEKLAT